MIDRKLVILTVALAAGAGIVLVVDRQQEKASHHTDSRVGQPLLAPADQAGIDHIEIKKPTGNVVLARDGDGVWHLGDSAGFPVDAAKVLRLLDDLGRTTYQMVVGTGKEQLGEFGLTTPASLTMSEKGQERLALSLGDNRKGGGEFVSTGGEYKVYLANPVITVAADSDTWELKTLLNLDKAVIKSVAFAPAATLAKQSVTVARDKKEDPLKVQALPPTEKENAMPSGVENQFGGMTFTKRYDSGNEEAKAALATSSSALVTLFDGRTYDIKVGSVGDKTKKYFLNIHAEPGATADDKAKKEVAALNALMATQSFEVAEWLAQRFEKGLADFTEAPGKG